MPQQPFVKIITFKTISHYYIFSRQTYIYINIYTYTHHLNILKLWSAFKECLTVVSSRFVLACSSHTRKGRHSLMKTLPFLPSLYVTCGTRGPSYWNELWTRLLLFFYFYFLIIFLGGGYYFPIALYLKSSSLQLHLPYGHELCSWTRTACFGT